MSYDLMVFDKQAAPSARPAFMNWFHTQTAWTENLDYNDPANASPALRNWFSEMRASFPPMNGPFEHNDPDDDRVTDYSVGSKVIYAAFAWSVADAAYQTTRALAQKHGAGFFDVSTENGEIATW